MENSFGMMPLADKDDEELRHTIISYAVKAVENNNVDIPKYTDEELADFIFELSTTGSDLYKRAKTFLKDKLPNSEETVLEWIFKIYAMDRLLALFQFYEYCGWLNSKGMIDHFGRVTSVYKALQGAKPDWCYLPYPLVLRAAYVELNAGYRTYIIRKYLVEHWDAAVDLLENFSGTPNEDFPTFPDVKWSHVYTQYKKMVAEKSRKYVREHKEVLRV